MQTSTNGRRMTLASTSKGKQQRPLRIVLFGTEGVGKSTFAADAPSPIFLCAETGTEHLDVTRFPSPRSWAEVIEALDTLRTEEHSYRTIAIDTLDWLEPIVWQQTIATKVVGGKRAENIEDYGYGKGYILALDVWRVLLARLDVLRDARGMNVILLAHSKVSNFKNPEGEDYQRYEMKLDGRASGLVKEWADCVLFTMHETLVHKQNNRAKGVSTGNRVVYTTRTAAYDAKNRHGLPDSLPLSWETFAAAVSGETPEVWRKRITTLLAGADEKLAEMVTKAVTDAGENPAQLAKIHNRLSVTRSKENAQ